MAYRSQAGLRFILATCLIWISLSIPLAQAKVEWFYVRHSGKNIASQPDSKKGTLNTTKIDGRPYISLKQFCFSFKCKVFYRWPKRKAFVQNKNGANTAILSSLTNVAIINGRVVDIGGNVVSDPQVGYRIPMDFAGRLALSLNLGHIEHKVRELQIRANKIVAPVQSLKVLVIDPGHGGEDIGTKHLGIQEKDLALIYARKIRDVIKKEMPELVVHMTRNDDSFVSLADRAKFANLRSADLFLSIHINYSNNVNAQGAETYILSPKATDDDARKTALLENKSWMEQMNIKTEEDTVKKIMIDLEQIKYIQDSALVGSMIQQELSTLNSLLGLKNRGVKQAMFYVLSQATMPSVLVEMGFLSNPGDRGRLMNVVFRDQFAKAVVQALKRYRNKLISKELSF